VAKRTKTGSDTLGDIAESLGTVLGNAEKQWRAWEGPRNAVVKAVTDVRDRAAALLSEMGAAADAAAGRGSKKDKKKDKRDKKKGKKARKAEKAAAEKAKFEAAQAERARAEQAARAPKAEKTAAKAAKKPGRKAAKKTARRAPRAAAPAPEPVDASDDGYEESLEAGDTSEF
jgi:hypothetical protein